MYRIINYFIASIWLINGFFCKLLNFVPRHTEIVANITGANSARLLTMLIGIGEILICILILFNIKPRLNTIFQIFIVAIMNILEFILVPNLLLWGRLNSVFALLFVGLIYYNEFVLKEKSNFYKR